MANEYWVSPSVDGTTASDTGTGMPGAAPLGAGLMQGNPDPHSINQVQINQTPAPQNPPQQLSATQLSSGLIATNAVPTNVNSAPGTDSLMAQMSRGQVIMADSTYGQSAFIPGNAGAGPVNNAAAVPVTARVASTLTFPSSAPTNHMGN
jgi:hypothetical protein